ncbi:hypothetical protein FBU30_002019 [Linnemannia zychae]|nr:hypothetical protein FBU30_002019 [Linnemannia zychae]
MLSNIGTLSKGILHRHWKAALTIMTAQHSKLKNEPIVLLELPDKGLKDFWSTIDQSETTSMIVRSEASKIKEKKLLNGLAANKDESSYPETASVEQDGQLDPNSKIYHDSNSDILDEEDSEEAHSGQIISKSVTAQLCISWLKMGIRIAQRLFGPLRGTGSKRVDRLHCLKRIFGASKLLKDSINCQAHSHVSISDEKVYGAVGAGMKQSFTPWNWWQVEYM